MVPGPGVGDHKEGHDNVLKTDQCLWLNSAIRLQKLLKYWFSMD